MPFDSVSDPSLPRAAAPQTRARHWTAALPLVATIRGAIARYAAIRQLRSLDDRLLRDIGLERGDIADVVESMQRGGRDCKTVTGRQ